MSISPETAKRLAELVGDPIDMAEFEYDESLALSEFYGHWFAARLAFQFVAKELSQAETKTWAKRLESLWLGLNEVKDPAASEHQRDAVTGMMGEFVSLTEWLVKRLD